jgi:hypothetical protein
MENFTFGDELGYFLILMISFYLIQLLFFCIYFIYTIIKSVQFYKENKKGKQLTIYWMLVVLYVLLFTLYCFSSPLSFTFFLYLPTAWLLVIWFIVAVIYSND